MEEYCSMKTYFKHFSAILSILLGSIIFLGCKESEEGIKAEYRDLTVAIYSTTDIKPRHVYTVYPQVSGVIESSILSEGLPVKKGDVLFRIKNKQALVNQETERLRYSLAAENYSGETTQLRELEKEIENARITLKNDSILYERRKRLWAKDLTSKQQLEAAQVKFETSKNTKNALINRYQRLEKELNNRLKLAQNNYTIRSLQEEDYSTNAMMDGTVYEVYKEIGETVNPQVPVALIGSTNDYVLFLQIDEVDIQEVFVGQRLVTSLDAYPNKSFEAKVTSIYPRKDDRSQTFTIEAEFAEPPSNLYYGLSGESNIIVQEKSDVLCLPSHYVTTDGKVKTKDGMKRVDTGLRSLQYVEIIAGIDSSTLVYQID
jgi:HlyD family secretion protein